MRELEILYQAYERSLPERIEVKVGLAIADTKLWASEHTGSVDTGSKEYLEAKRKTLFYLDQAVKVLDAPAN